MKNSNKFVFTIVLLLISMAGFHSQANAQNPTQITGQLTSATPQDCDDCFASIGSVTAYPLPNSCKITFVANDVTFNHLCTFGDFEWVICVGERLEIVYTSTAYLLDYDFTGWGAGNVHVYCRIRFPNPNNTPWGCHSDDAVCLTALPGC